MKRLILLIILASLIAYMALGRDRNARYNEKQLNKLDRHDQIFDEN